MTYTATRDELIEALDNARRTKAACVESGDLDMAQRIQVSIDRWLDAWDTADPLDANAAHA